MKNVLHYLSYAPRKLVAALVVLAFAAMPLVGIYAAENVLIEGSLGVANQTAGETRWEESTNASFDDEVIFQIYYHNRELCESDRVAKNLAVNVDLPQLQAGETQNVSVEIKGDNTNEISDIATVNLDRADASLQFMPGTVVWKHNQATNGDEDIVTETLPDSVVTGDGYQVIEDTKPCAKYDATITFKARIVVPSVEVTKYVRVAGEGDYARTNTANPGDTLEYVVGYKNAGNTEQKQVIIRDSLPPLLDYIEGSTELKNASTGGDYDPFNSDEVVDDGIVIGNYTPGSNAYVKFQAKIPHASNLECGITEFRNVGVAQPEGMNEFYNTTSTTVEKECEDDEQEEPVYRCEMLSADDTQLKRGQEVTFTADTTARNGASIEQYHYDFGDGSDVLVTDQTTVAHTYDEAGEYRATLEVVFDVDGERQTDGGEECAVNLHVQSETPSEKSEQPEEPDEIVNTGVASALMAITGTSAVGQAVSSFVKSRRSLRDILKG